MFLLLLLNYLAIQTQIFTRLFCEQLKVQKL